MKKKHHIWKKPPKEMKTSIGKVRYKYGIKPVSYVDIRTVDLGPRQATHRADLYQKLLDCPEGQGVVYRFSTWSLNQGKRSREYQTLAVCLKRYFYRRGMDVSMHIIKQGKDKGNAVIIVGHAPFQWIQRQRGILRETIKAEMGTDKK